MLVARFGYVDKHGGCKPSENFEGTWARKNLLLTSKPFYGIRIPVLRTVVRIGMFLENTGDSVCSHPRLVLETLPGHNALAFRVKLTYRMGVNRMGGEMLMLQGYDECKVYPSFGTHLGTIEFQYPLFSAPPLIECHISTFTPDVRNKQSLLILIND